MVKFLCCHWKKESLSDKCSLDKLAEAPGSRQLDVGQTKNYHHSQEKEIEHCPLTNSKIKMDFCNILQSIAKYFIETTTKNSELCRCPTFPDLFKRHCTYFMDICTTLHTRIPGLLQGRFLVGGPSGQLFCPLNTVINTNLKPPHNHHATTP